MGLFGGIISGLGGILGSVIGAKSNAKAINKATDAQQAAMQAAIDEQARQYDTTRSDFAPYLSAGTKALPGIMDLLGLNGPQAANAAIAALKSSPVFQSLYNTGEEAVLQNASATGGLRGGNTQGALYELGDTTLSRVIADQLSRLGGLAGLGENATGSVAGFGAHSADAISGLNVGQGQVAAGGILGKQNVYNNMANQISSIISSVIGGGI